MLCLKVGTTINNESSTAKPQEICRFALAQLKYMYTPSVLLSHCKQSVTSLLLLVGTTVVFLHQLSALGLYKYFYKSKKVRKTTFRDILTVKHKLVGSVTTGFSHIHIHMFI